MKKELKTKKLKLTTLGFTLVELLAVIVILAVIGLITVPIIGNIIEDSKKKALEASVYGIVEAANYFAISNNRVQEFLFDENKKGETATGDYALAYKGQVDAEGKLYIDQDGNISLCLMNETYYVYKNYNGGIYIGDRAEEGDCIVKYDALTNKYVAKLDDGTGTVAEYYTKDEIDVMLGNLNTSLNNYALKSDVEALSSTLNNYALQSELNKTNTTVNNINTQVTTNKNNITALQNSLSNYATKAELEEVKKGGLENLILNISASITDKTLSTSSGTTIDFSSYIPEGYTLIASRLNVTGTAYQYVNLVPRGAAKWVAIMTTESSGKIDFNAQLYCVKSEYVFTE